MGITSRLIHKKSLTHDVHDVFSDCSVVVFRSSFLRMFLIIGDLIFHHILSTFPAFQTWLPFAALYCSDNLCAFWGNHCISNCGVSIFREGVFCKMNFLLAKKHLTRSRSETLSSFRCFCFFVFQAFSRKAHTIFSKRTRIWKFCYIDFDWNSYFQDSTWPRSPASIFAFFPCSLDLSTRCCGKEGFRAFPFPVLHPLQVLEIATLLLWYFFSRAVSVRSWHIEDRNAELVWGRSQQF